jgi:hypothetical protein
MLCHNYGTMVWYTCTYVSTDVAIKTAKYADQPNFVPFIVETGGYINRRAHLFLDTIRGSQGPAPPPTPGPRSSSGDVTPRRRAQSQLAAVYPPKTHVVLGAHVCPFPIRFDKTLEYVPTYGRTYARTYVPWYEYTCRYTCT